MHDRIQKFKKKINYRGAYVVCLMVVQKKKKLKETQANN